MCFHFPQVESTPALRENQSCATSAVSATIVESIQSSALMARSEHPESGGKLGAAARERRAPKCGFDLALQAQLPAMSVLADWMQERQVL